MKSGPLDQPHIKPNAYKTMLHALSVIIFTLYSEFESLALCQILYERGIIAARNTRIPAAKFTNAIDEGSLIAVCSHCLGITIELTGSKKQARAPLLRVRQV